MKLAPSYVDKPDASRLQIAVGWWAVAPDGTPVSGPYPTEEAAKVGIAKRGQDQPTGMAGTAGPAPE